MVTKVKALEVTPDQSKSNQIVADKTKKEKKEGQKDASPRGARWHFGAF